VAEKIENCDQSEFSLDQPINTYSKYFIKEKPNEEI